MHLPAARSLAFAIVAGALAFSPAVAFAQNGDAKGGDQHPPAQGEGTKETQKKVEEIAAAASALKDAAGQPECVWLGHRVVVLLWRDDLDTAFRHLELYDRFGCPGAHIQASFRCLVQQSSIDPKVPESLNNRAQACWINPANPAPPPSAAAAAAPGTASR